MLRGAVTAAVLEWAGGPGPALCYIEMGHKHNTMSSSVGESMAWCCRRGVGCVVYMMGVTRTADTK